MNRLLLLLVVLGGSGCFQQLDPRASSGSAPAAPAPPKTPTIALDTPPIELPDGQTTTSACVLINLQASAILQTNCAGCHGGGSPGARQGQPPFDCVMDVEKLKTMVSTSVRDPRDPTRGMRFLIPGDPDNSRLYVRIARAEMPPVPPLGLDPIPLPSVSDLSLLRTWITSCLGAPEVAAAAGGSDGSAPAAGVGAGGGSDGGHGADGGAGPPVSRLNAGEIRLHDAGADAGLAPAR